MSNPFEALRRIATDYPLRTLVVLIFINYMFVLGLHTTEIGLEGMTLGLIGQMSAIACFFALGMYVFIRYM